MDSDLRVVNELIRWYNLAAADYATRAGVTAPSPLRQLNSLTEENFSENIELRKVDRSAPWLALLQRVRELGMSPQQFMLGLFAALSCDLWQQLPTPASLATPRCVKLACDGQALFEDRVVTEFRTSSDIFAKSQHLPAYVTPSRTATVFAVVAADELQLSPLFRYALAVTMIPSVKGNLRDQFERIAKRLRTAAASQLGLCGSLYQKHWSVLLTPGVLTSLGVRSSNGIDHAKQKITTGDSVTCGVASRQANRSRNPPP
jgi:hypothetical protein